MYESAKPQKHLQATAARHLAGARNARSALAGAHQLLDQILVITHEQVHVHRCQVLGSYTRIVP